ncbi:MAG TPA: thiol-disulfide oxidoreductase ResA [Candidatus Dormibacteraeota bacterium]|nr:thiol-disulfide oxidoreductase ResA [Candidatus Dormibacteraeota bacterium]
MSLDKIREKKKSKIRNRLIFRSVILAVLIGAVVFSLVTNAQKDKTIYKVGDEAPDFKLTQINKNNELETVQLSDYRGKGVMLNFWATFCEPCEAEMPYMEKLYPKYKDLGIEIIAVNLDLTELVVDRFIDKHDLTFPIPHDKKSQVTDLYKIGPIPTTYFINPEGIIVEKIEQALTLEHLEGYFQEILPE